MLNRLIVACGINCLIDVCVCVCVCVFLAIIPTHLKLVKSNGYANFNVNEI